MKQEIERFEARSDDGAYETTIIIYQKIIDAGTMQNPHATILGLREAHTIDGSACNIIDDDTFEVVDDPLHPKIIVRRIR